MLWMSYLVIFLSHLLLLEQFLEPVLMKSKDYALAVAAKPALGNVGFTIVSILCSYKHLILI
jgi:hypothetical protein